MTKGLTEQELSLLQKGKSHSQEKRQPQTPQSAEPHAEQKGGVVDPEQFDGDAYLENLLKGAGLATQAMEQAGFNNGAAFIQRKSQELAVKTQHIKQALKPLMNPDAPLCLAILELAQEENARGAVPLEIRLGKYQVVAPPVPSLPDFSSWYASSQPESRSEHLLGDGSNPNTSNTSDVPLNPPTVPQNEINGNGKPQTENFKGFGNPQKN